MGWKLAESCSVSKKQGSRCQPRWIVRGNANCFSMWLAFRFLQTSVRVQFEIEMRIDRILKITRFPLHKVQHLKKIASPLSSARNRNSDPERRDLPLHDVAVTLLAKTLFTLSRVTLSPPGENEDPDFRCRPTHIASTA